MRGRVVTYVLAAALLLIFCAALAVLDAERHANGANITQFGDALWWACVTVSTVGYGDLYPVTVEGRFVAVGLMVGGIALIGVVTAAFASWLIDRVRDVEAGAQAATSRELAEVLAELRRMKAAIDGHSAVPAVPRGDLDGAEHRATSSHWSSSWFMVARVRGLRRSST